MKKILTLFLLLVVGKSGFAATGHKIVFLISPPRSLSVAFMRMVEARGDFKVFHEPTMRAYHMAYNKDVTEGWFHEGSLKSYGEVKDAILDASRSSHVFVKEMGYSAKDLIFNNPEFLASPDVYFVFLLRNPHHALISYYKKWSLVPNFATLTGYDSTFEIFQAVSKHAVNKPLFLFSEEVAAHPRPYVEAFCRHIDLPFKESSLSWQDLGDHFDGHQAWADCKTDDVVYHWHGDAIHSTHFGALTTYAVDHDGLPTFSEIKSVEDRAVCQRLYQTNLHYYNRLREAAVHD